MSGASVQANTLGNTLEAPTPADAAAVSALPAPGAACGSDRRRVLGLAAIGAVLGSLARESKARQSTPVATAALDADPSALLEKLIDRLTFGATPAERQLANQLGYEGYLEYHLNPDAIAEDPIVDQRLANLTSIGMTYAEATALSSGQVRNELIEATIYRAIFSRKQLLERMVEFWTDHFNIDMNFATYYKSMDDRLVIRPNALGTFAGLLNASARSPAMLYYLNNNVSTASNPNENYARELMELHTLGVDGGYTQTDVQEVAKCLTGWTIWGQSGGPELWGTYRYNNANHNQTQKVVLGVTIPPNGGQQDGVTVLNLLVNHPSTARFIAGKLCRWMLGYAVSSAIVDKVTAVYTSTGGDIKAMLREVLRPQHLAAAPPKLKRPFHHFVSSMRQTACVVTSTATIRSRLSEALHLPFTWTTPDGFPDKLDFWGNNVIVRWNFGATLANGSFASPGMAGVAFDDAAFFAGATTATQMIDRINDRLFAGRMPQAERDRIRTYLLPDPPSTTRRREAVGLAIGSPAYQWY